MNFTAINLLVTIRAVKFTVLIYNQLPRIVLQEFDIAVVAGEPLHKSFNKSQLLITNLPLPLLRPSLTAFL